MRVLVIGGINADVVVRVDHRPLAGETVVGDGPRWVAGGKGANMAVAAASVADPWGATASVAMLGEVGDDPLGRAQVTALETAGVDASRVRSSAQHGTGVALIVVTPDGENSIVVGGGANRHLVADDVEEGVARWCEPSEDITGHPVVLAQAEVGRSPVEAAARAAGRTDARLVLSPAPVLDLDADTYRGADPVIVNAEEARALLAQHAPPTAVAAAIDQGHVALTRALGSALGCRSAVVTLGAEGAVVADEHGVTQVVARPVPAREVVDTTGAGDVLAGVVAARLSAGASLADAVMTACSAAAECVRRHGAR